MEREQKKPNNVEGGHVNVLESVNHHRKDIVMVQRVVLQRGKMGIEFAAGKMEQVKDNEGEHNKAAHGHVTRSIAGFDVIPLGISGGPCGAILDREANREINMQGYSDDQDPANDPQQG